jgi:hypothetical protein
MNRDTSKPTVLYIYFLHTAIGLIIQYSLVRVVVMFLYILKKRGKKLLLTASPDRILSLIFNGANVVFIEQNWHNHNFCSLEYRI